MTENIIPDITERIDNAMAGEARVFPCHTNRASSIGHPCERFLVYMRTDWDKRKLPDVTLQYIFNGGNMIEAIAKEYLRKAGFEIIHQQRDFHDRKFNISGHIDGTLKDPQTGKKFPLEIKGISPFEFNKVNAIEDFLHSKKHYMRAYPAQLQMYLYLSEYEYGLFMLVNKLTYRPKFIWCQLDYDFVEGLLRKAERVNKHIEAGTYPERINDFDICSKCGFAHICLPELKNMKGLDIIDSDELSAKIERLMELKPSVKEYNSLDAEIKQAIEGKEQLLVGDWYITQKLVKKVLPAQPEREVEYWQKKIVRVAQKEG